MAFSYCATAISRAARAASRLAWLRPMSKIGRLMLGPNDQARLAALNRPSRSPLTRPRLPVSEMRGKKLARAAPMLALAPINCCSAARMSGRRSSRSDGRPAATSAKVGKSAAGCTAAVACVRSRGASAVTTAGTGGIRRSGTGWPTSRVSRLMSCARRRCCWARVACALADSDSASRMSSADDAPLSKRSLVRRSDRSRVPSVRSASASSSVSVFNCSQVLATLAIRLICADLRASSVAR